MKPGLHIGESTEVEINVSPEMRAAFEDETVHELYSTSALVHHMELAARKIILPYLEAHEEGMGSHVELSHLMLTLPGMRVRIKAIVSDIRDNKIVCDIEAFNTRGKIAKGTVTQAIIEKEWLSRKMKEMSVIHHLSQERAEA